MKTRQRQFIVLLHAIGITEKIRVDFISENPAIVLYKALRLDEYSIYQYILDDHRYVMETKELEKNQVQFKLYERKEKTWFGLGKKTVSDLLIYPKSDFFYPYHYGHYFYLYTKYPLNEHEFENWLNEQFPNRFSNFDDTFAGINTQTIQLMHDDDYLIVTNYDYQEQFGITGTMEIIELIRNILKSLELREFEEEKYVQLMK